MSYLLHIDATSFDAESISRRVALVPGRLDGWTGEVVHRDLAAAPIPHLTAAGYLFTVLLYNYGIPSSFKA